MNEITIDGVTMKAMGQMSPVRAWLKYSDISTQLDTSGVYAIQLCNEVVYVGQSCNLFARLLEHCCAMFSNTPSSDPKYELLRKHYKDLSWTVLTDADTLILLETESYYISKYSPIFNIETPKGRKYFHFKDSDIDDFCCGLLTMDDLRKMVDDVKPTKKDKQIVIIEDLLDESILLPDILLEGIKTHNLHSNAVNEIMQVIMFKQAEEKRIKQPCRVIVEINDNRLIATSYDAKNKVIGKYIGRQRRIWDLESKMKEKMNNDQS